MIAALSIGALFMQQSTAKVPLKSPASFVVDKSLVAQVMALGVWHFAFPDKDDHKTAKSDRVDVLEPERQTQLRTLLDDLKKFNPTKICVEVDDQSYVDKIYDGFRDGKHQTSRNEVVQIGFKLALELNQKKVYAIDCGELLDDLDADKTFSSWAEDLWKKSQPKATERDPYDSRYSTLYNYNDQVVKDNTIEDGLLYLNSDEAVRMSHGAYLTKLAKGAENSAADVLATWWYDRNLRIFSKVAKLKEPHDRILVIIGAGHLPILKQCFESSPEFEWVPVQRYLSPGS